MVAVDHRSQPGEPPASRRWTSGVQVLPESTSRAPVQAYHQVRVGMMEESRIFCRLACDMSGVPPKRSDASGPDRPRHVGRQAPRRARPCPISSGIECVHHQFTSPASSCHVPPASTAPNRARERQGDRDDDDSGCGDHDEDISSSPPGLAGCRRPGADRRAHRPVISPGAGAESLRPRFRCRSAPETAGRLPPSACGR